MSESGDLYLPATEEEIEENEEAVRATGQPLPGFAFNWQWTPRVMRINPTPTVSLGPAYDYLKARIDTLEDDIPGIVSDAVARPSYRPGHVVIAGVAPQGRASDLVGALAANRHYAIPTRFEVDVTITTMGFFLDTPQASSTTRLGIAAMLPTGLPGALLLSPAAIDTTASGVKSVAASFTFAAHTWYAILIASSHAIGMRVITPTHPFWGLAGLGNGELLSSCYADRGNNTFVDPFGTVGGYLGWYPRVLMVVA